MITLSSTMSLAWSGADKRGSNRVGQGNVLLGRAHAERSEKNGGRNPGAWWQCPVYPDQHGHRLDEAECRSLLKRPPTQNTPTQQPVANGP